MLFSGALFPVPRYSPDTALKRCERKPIRIAAKTKITAEGTTVMEVALLVLLSLPVNRLWKVETSRAGDLDNSTHASQYIVAFTGLSPAQPGVRSGI